MFNKIRKHNKLLSWLILLSIIVTLGSPSWSDEPEDSDGDGVIDETDIAAAEPKVDYDVPRRDEEELWNKMESVAKNEHLELRVLEKDEYIGMVKTIGDLIVHDSKGEPIDYVEGMFEASDNMVEIHDENGTLVDTRVVSRLGQVPDKEDESITRLTYKGDVYEEVSGKEKREGTFAVRAVNNGTANGFIWWSNPINSTLDPYANGLQVNKLNSPIMFRAGNHDSGTAANLFSNTIENDRSTGSQRFVNACTGIEKITNGARFNYNFPQRTTKISMEITLEGKSVLVNIPQERLIEEEISGESGSVMLTLSLLNSFGAAPEREGGYIVVPDGSGAVIEFDNNKVNSAQYSGQVYGRDYAVSQRLAPPVTQQVYLPVFGIVRNKGENALVAIAENGAENATVRAAVSRQGSRASGNALANTTSYNLAWFDFAMRTTDTFRIGTKNVELSIYESEYIKTGDISVRYYPLSVSDSVNDELSYVDIANTYRDYLIEKHDSLQEGRMDSNATPFYMTLNGGTQKRHSIMGLPFNLQTAATTYSQAAEMVESLNSNGIEDLVITFNEFNTAKIKGEISASVQYSSILGGKSGYNSLSSTVGKYGYSLYPSLGFMEFRKSGNGYNFLLHSSKEITRSVARQQKYELAFGTPDPLQSSTTILSPYYFPDAFDSIIKSFTSNGINTISLDNATSLLYSDFSRKNPFGNIYFNRRDTVQILTEGYAKLNSAGISILAQSANSYALPYVSHISNVPLSSSNYDIFDYDIPFYQIVIHGLIPYSTTPFNASSNLNALTLLAISTATPVHYQFMYEDAGEFNDSEYDNLYFATFDGWENDAVNTYKMFDELIGDVLHERIVKHTRLEDDEFETVFESGKTIYINLRTSELAINGVTVDLEKYNTGIGR
ncbi:MAG: DUF5696 domain-containing protein [Oscillospiraceae bacterium]|nr:DUF5696 domain-containing protein [Oscillospiraceae bacterium]